MDPYSIFSFVPDTLMVETAEFKRAMTENLLKTADFPIKTEISANVVLLEKELEVINENLNVNTSSQNWIDYLLIGSFAIFAVIFKASNCNA